jgi:hypothetical protein
LSGALLAGWLRLRLRFLTKEGAVVQAKLEVKAKAKRGHPATYTFSLNLNLDLSLPRSLDLNLFLTVVLHTSPGVVSSRRQPNCPA